MVDFHLYISSHEAYVALSVIIFSIVSFNFLFPCNAFIPLDRRTMAVVGALACYLLGTFVFPSRSIDMLHAIDFDVLVLLASIMVVNHIVVHLRETKKLIYSFQCLLRKDGMRGFWMLSFIAFIVSPFLTNDGVCLLLVEPVLNTFEPIDDAEMADSQMKNETNSSAINHQEHPFASTATEEASSHRPFHPNNPMEISSAEDPETGMIMHTNPLSTRMNVMSSLNSSVASTASFRSISDPKNRSYLKKDKLHVEHETEPLQHQPASKNVGDNLPPMTREDAFYFLLALACSTNIGSALTYTGNPQNMIVASDAIDVMPPYKFTLYMLLPSLVTWYITIKVIEICWKRNQNARFEQQAAMRHLQTSLTQPENILHQQGQDDQAFSSSSSTSMTMATSSSLHHREKKRKRRQATILVAGGADVTSQEAEGEHDGEEKSPISPQHSSDPRSYHHRHRHHHHHAHRSKSSRHHSSVHTSHSQDLPPRPVSAPSNAVHPSASDPGALSLCLGSSSHVTNQSYSSPNFSPTRGGVSPNKLHTTSSTSSLFLLSPSGMSAKDVSSKSSNQQMLLSPRRRRARQQEQEQTLQRVVRVVASPFPYLVIILLFAMIVMIFVDIMPISALICVAAIVMVLSVVFGNHCCRGGVVWESVHGGETPSIINMTGKSTRSDSHAKYMSTARQEDEMVLNNNLESRNNDEAVLSAKGNDLGPMTREDKLDSLNEFFEELFKSIDYSLLFIFLGTFIVVENMAETGIPRRIWRSIVGAVPFATITSITGISIFIIVASQLLGNVAVVQLAKPNVGDLAANEKRMAWAIISFVSTVGGNLTITGSAANIIVAEKANRLDPTIQMNFFRHFKICFLVTLFSCALGAAMLYVIISLDNYIMAQ